MAFCNPATKASGVYGSSAACSTVTISFTRAAARSAAGPAVLAPATRTTISPPIVCAAAMVSHDARFSLPSRCSAITRIIRSLGTRSSELGARDSLQYPRLVAQLAHELPGGLGRRTAEDLRFLAFLRRVQRNDLLPGRGRRGHRRLPDLFLLGGHDALERC